MRGLINFVYLYVMGGYRMACAERKDVLCDPVPALFMTAVCTTYILVAPEGFGLSYVLSCAVGGGVAVLLFGMFMKWYLQFKKTRV